MQYDELMQQLSAMLGLPGIAYGDSGECTLGFDDVVVIFEPEPELFLVRLTSILGDIGDHPPETYEELLSANLLGAGTGGATLALNPGGQVVLTRRVFISESPFESFVHDLESFVNHAELWTGVLRRTQDAGFSQSADCVRDFIRG